MNKIMAALLIGATALPGLASAQDWRGEHRGERGQSPRPAPQAPAPQQPPAHAPAPAFQARPEGQHGGWDGARRFDRSQAFAGQPQPQPQQFQRQLDGRGWEGRRDRGQAFDGQPQSAPQNGYDQRFDHRDGRPGGYPAPGFRPGPGTAYRGDPDRNPFRTDGYHGGAQPFVGVPRGGNYGYRPDYNRGGGWNRGWRGDRRYDWGSYRRYNGELFRLPRYSAPYGWGYGYQRFGVGVVIEEALFAPDYWIDDPYEYRLPPVDGPYRWVRYYNDALLVDMETGEVVDVVYGIFY